MDMPGCEMVLLLVKNFYFAVHHYGFRLLQGLHDFAFQPIRCDHELGPRAHFALKVIVHLQPFKNNPVIGHAQPGDKQKTGGKLTECGQGAGMEPADMVQILALVGQSCAQGSIRDLCYLKSMRDVKGDGAREIEIEQPEIKG